MIDTFTAKSVAKKSKVLYPNAHWYFILAIVTTWIGFWTSYFARLGDTDIYHHIHGASAGLWLVTMVIQPILYQRGYLALHRKIGRYASYILVPALVIGGIKMMQMMIQSKDSYPPGSVYRLSYIDAYSLVLFILFFGLSLWHSKNIHLHARYMACTVLTVLPPAIARLLFFVPGFNSFDKTLNGSFVITEIILLLLIYDDRKTGPIRKPYPVALILFLILHLTMNYAHHWIWWENIMNSFAS